MKIKINGDYHLTYLEHKNLQISQQTVRKDTPKMQNPHAPDCPPTHPPTPTPNEGPLKSVKTQ